MKRFRTVVFWAHLVTALGVGVVVFVMSVTGTLLMFQREITAWADHRSLNTAPPSAGAERIPPEALLRRVERATGDTVTSFTLRSDPSGAATVGLGPGRTLLVNAYTGEVVGEGSPAVRAFFQVVIRWHRHFGAADDNRAAGRAITGTSNLAFLFLVTSGCYLWWPRNWAPRAVASLVFFQRGLSPKARDFNWHNTIGFWSALPLFIVVLSGVVLSFPWANALVYRVMGEAPPAVRGGTSQASAPKPKNTDRFENLDLLFERAAGQTADWRTIAVPLPRTPVAHVTFTLDAGDGGSPQKRSTLTLDRATGELVRWEPFSSGTPGRKLRTVLRFAHTGEVLGLFGQTIAGLASLGAAFLVWTGFSLALRRFRAWRARRGSVPLVA